MSFGLIILAMLAILGIVLISCESFLKKIFIKLNDNNYEKNEKEHLVAMLYLTLIFLLIVFFIRI